MLRHSGVLLRFLEESEESEDETWETWERLMEVLSWVAKVD